MTGGRLVEAVAFDAAVNAPDGYGGNARTWVEQFATRAHFKYERGAEAVDAGGLTGTAVFAVKIRSSAASRSIDATYRMRDTRRGLSYNVRQVDAVTDRAWVWLRVENGVAV